MEEQVEAAPKAWVLNEKQQEAHDWLVSFVLGEISEYRRALFTGYAGTGKTFTINRMVESVRKANRYIEFGMTAPTHKAVRVLKKHSEKKNEMEFGTIHSFLALKETIDPKTGEVDFKPDFNPNRERKIDQVHVLIVDESSMLQDKLFEYIEDEMRSNPNLRVIYMGDPLQIPPVRSKEEERLQQERGGHRDAIPFQPARQEAHRIHVLSLIEPQRQAADSPIIMYAHAIREQHASSYIDFEFREEYKHALELVPRKIEALREIFLQYFKTTEFDEDPDYFKVICWRNDTRDYFNKMIRLLMYNKEELPKIIAGEKMIMDAPLLKGDKILIANNEDVVAIKVEVKTVPITYRMKQIRTVFDKMPEDPSKELKTWQCKVYAVTLMNPEGQKFETIILHEHSEQDFKEIQENIRILAIKHTDMFARKEMWKQFYDLQKKFAQTQYNYCVTGHKSQGSTYSYTMSMEWDIEQHWIYEERNRIRYVAATRARNKLFIVR